MGFLSSTTVTNGTSVNEFMTTSGKPFYWLYLYIKHLTNKTSYQLADWQYVLYSFFNRTSKARNDAGDIAANTYDFSEMGKPEYWRIWWQEYACGLVPSIKYTDVLPSNWTRINGPTDQSTYIKDDPRNWYQWNDAAANPGKLLGWYYGEKDPTTWTDNVNQVTIVHNVNRSGNLIAIWVDKEIREDKNNYDVQMLMSKQGTTHDVKVYHPLQAGMYNTICLPFPLSTLEGTPYAGATVLRLVESELENENVTEENLSDNNVLLQFEQVTFSDRDIMEAGVPYLIMPAADITGMVTFTGIDRNSVYTGEGKSIETDYITMHGRINPTILEADNNTLILVSNNQLAVTSEKGEMLGLRAYFTLSGTAYAYGMSGQTVMQLQKQTPTAVEEIEDVIPETPAAKGKKVMYQGQLYILRDGKAYNMQGQVVGTSEEIIP